MSMFLQTDITSQIMELCQWICEGGVGKIEAGMSLTRDLGFDSMKLMQFFAGIEDFYPGIALEEWFIQHSSGGRDTIDSVIFHLARALTPMAAE
jgi:acyl carrier protein